MNRKFASLGALGLFFRNVSIPSMVLAEHEILEMAGRRIAERARQKIGVPQAGWPPLQESTVERKQREGYARPEAPLYRSGELKDSIEYVVHSSESMVEIGTNHKAAAVHELGSAHTPPRPFLAPAALEVMGDMQAEIPQLLGAAIMGEVK
jgi:phage gpG-like protein